MSHKHYFPSTAANTLVLQHLTSLTTSTPTLRLLPPSRVIYTTTHTPSHIALISGGGSGHEPAWSGYVGSGLLSAAVCGDIFASPSAKQVLDGIKAVPSNEGTILLVTNYTGDKLHFGLAAEKALAGGVCRRLVVLSCMDDVAIGRSGCGRVGRRGLAGNVLIMKVLGAACEERVPFEKCVEMGEAINSQLVSIGSALDHCHVPGRQGYNPVSDDEVYVGSGIHNEPGAQRISPFPSTSDIINHMLLLLLDPKDTDRAFVKFNPKDEVVLLINNYGGLSTLELGALSQEVLEQLETKWKINPVQRYIGTFETSLNGPGFSITLLNLTNTASICSTTTSELLRLLNADTGAPCWPNVKAHAQSDISQNGHHKIDVEDEVTVADDEDIKVDPKLLDSIVRQACKRAIEAEPNLTKWDTIMGDGDCGEGVKDVCEAILSKLDTNLTTTISGSVPTLLISLLPIVDNMGGTLGAIFGILLAAFTTHLRATIKASHSTTTSPPSSSPTQTPVSQIFSTTLSLALISLQTHTAARTGDRTIMDVLIPFSTTFSDPTKGFAEAVEVAREAAEGTRGLKARFGRASYVGVEEGEGQDVPDPGAWAFMEIVRGVGEVVGGEE